MSTATIHSRSVPLRNEEFKGQETESFLANTNEDLNVNNSNNADFRESSFSSKAVGYRSQTEDPRVSSDSSTTRMLRHGKEIVCLLALLLTTFAAIQNKPLKLGRPLQPKAFFPKKSVVQDWPAGQLEMLQRHVSLSELSLVFFYAPWCSESDFAKNVYEEVANEFHEDIYFAAVNCWQPGGECRIQYSKVHSWPVLMAYYQGGLAVQYTAPWNALSLTNFIENLMSPVKRIRSKNSLLKMRAENDAVIAGFFENIKSDLFLLYREAAFKWLEQDPLQDLKFSVITGRTIKEFNVTDHSAIKLYLWNDTMSYANEKWCPSKIIKWIKRVAGFNVQWINLPSKKSSVLTSHLKNSPSVLLFTHRDYVLNSNSDYFLVIRYNKCVISDFIHKVFWKVKQIAWEYSTCENSSRDNHLDYDFILQGTGLTNLRFEAIKKLFHAHIKNKFNIGFVPFLRVF